MDFPNQRTDSPPARPAPPYPEDPHTATRHLCAGAYLDDEFRNESLREVYYEGYRAVAPSYGFDAVPVLAHCLRARNATLVRDAIILGTVVIAACSSMATLLVVLSCMAALHATIATYRLARESLQRLRDGRPVDVNTLGTRALLLLLGWALAAVAITWATGSLLSTASDAFGTGGLEGASTAAVGIGFGSLSLGLLIFLAPVIHSLWRQAELSRMAPGARITQPVRNPRLDDIARQQRGNTTVYSGFNQYVGSGYVIDSWGFAQRLVRAQSTLDRVADGLGAPRHAGGQPSEREREFGRPPFDAQEVVDYVRAHLSDLLPHREAEEQISGLTVEDRVCLAGTEVTDLAPHTPPDTMAAVVRHPTTPARHYLACQVFGWGGQLITTVYVHIAVQGRSLYLELTTTALPPVDERFRIVDTMQAHGSAAWVAAVKAGLADTPRTIWRSPVNLTAGLINLVAGSSGLSGTGRLDRGFDYGARVGIRELGSQAGPRFRTQVQDFRKYKKLIERRVIASVLDFLDDRGVDTTEYRMSSTSILVNGSGNQLFNRVSGNGVLAGGNVAKGGAA